MNCGRGLGCRLRHLWMDEGGYVILAHVSTGELATAALHNDLLDDVAVLRAGGIAIASQAAGDVPYATSATQFGRVNGSGLLQLNGSSAPTIASLPLSLIGEAENTDTNASAANVATFAISGLTAKDVLRVVTVCSSLTQLTALPQIYHATDSIRMAYINLGSNIAAGQFVTQETIFWVDQSNTKQMLSLAFGGAADVSVIAENFGSVQYRNVVLTTDWTAAWTLALRHGGVTAGGTFRYRASVYKMAGQ